MLYDLINSCQCNGRVLGMRLGAPLVTTLGANLAKVERLCSIALYKTGVPEQSSRMIFLEQRSSSRLIHELCTLQTGVRQSIVSTGATFL